MARRRRRNPTALDLLPWLLGGAAVIGTAIVAYNNGKSAATQAATDKLAQGIVSDAATANAKVKVPFT